MSHRDNFIKKNKELNKPMDIFNVGFVGAAGGIIPDQVTGAEVTPDSTTELTVTWNAVTATPAVSGYLVERSPNGSDSWATVAASHSTTTFADSNLSVYTYYYYRVSAINSIGTGDVSSTVNNRTLGTVPNQVTGLSASATSTSNINLSWSVPSSSPAITNYTIQRSTDNSSWGNDVTTTSTSLSVGSLSTYTVYYFHVRANNAVGSGSYSSSANARTNGTVPNQVTGLSASATSQTNIDLTWSAATGGAPASYTYYLQRSLNNSSWGNPITTSSTSASSGGLSAATLYYYQVRAYNSIGNGSYSSSVSATTDAIVLSDIGVIAGGYGNKSSIEYIIISTTSNSLSFGDLTVGRSQVGACCNGTRGVFAGDTANIDYITMASAGNATTFGVLSNTYGATGVDNGTRGVFGGVISSTSKMEYITISSTGNATSFGTMSLYRSSFGSCDNGSRGVFAGGYVPVGGGAGSSNVMDYITIASTGNATDFGNLTAVRHGFGGGASNGTRGVFAGGYSDTPVGASNVMDYITIASTGNATDFGDLVVARDGNGGTSNATRGVWFGGWGGLGSMEYITISSAGNAASFGNLLVDRARGGATSDA